jgi:hypothetical protein
VPGGFVTDGNFRGGDPTAPRILASFNRRHLGPFCRRFMASLRASGNDELVTPVAIGLYPSEQRQLASLAGVRPIFLSENGGHAARRRLREFAAIATALPPATPIAYWDAGDVVFQARLAPLWSAVAKHPGKILAAPEPMTYSANRAMILWAESIADPAERRDVQRTLTPHQVLNSGFAAGSASAMKTYFDVVARWYESPRLAGTTDPGDQLGLNVYCYTRPEAWQEVSEGWNYCLFGRPPKSCFRSEDGRYVDARGTSVYVVHGNARTLEAAPFRRTACY